MKQSTPRVLNEQVVVATNNSNTIKRHHQPRTLISSSQYLDSCGGGGGHSSSSSSSTSSCCSSTSNSTSGFASTSSILSDHQQQQQQQQPPAQQAASVSPGGGGGLSKPSVLTSRQQQRRRSWLSGSLGQTTNTTTTTSCGPLTTSQEDDEEEEDADEETPRSTPFSLASSTPTQQQSPSSFLLGAAFYSGTIVEEETVSGPRSPDVRGNLGADRANTDGETNWLLAGDSASSSSSSNEGDDLGGANGEISTSTGSCSESSHAQMKTHRRTHDSKRTSHRGNRKRKKRRGRRAHFWRLVASSTSGDNDSSSNDGHSTTTSGSGDDEQNCDPKICDNLEDEEEEDDQRGRRRETSSCPLQDLFDYSQESNPNNRPRLVLAGAGHFLGNQLWQQQQQQQQQAHEFATTSSPQLLSAVAAGHLALARLNSIHEDSHETDQQQRATLASNDFKVSPSSPSSSSSSRADNDDDEQVATPIRGEQEEEPNVSSNAEEEVELGQVNRGAGDGDVHSDGDDAQDDDDDYFYDEELSFSHQRRLVGGVCSGRTMPSGRSTTTLHARPSIPTVESPAVPAVATPTNANDLIARLSGARPLLVWAPTARRTSCPVGQLTSFASWRQLWPAQPPAAAIAPPAVQLCAQCASNQQATATDSPVHWSEASQQQQPPAAGLSTVKSSRTSLACSDYFSSFDQTDQATTTTTTHQQPPANTLRRRLGGYSNPMQAASAGLHANQAELPPLELRRQSTITGFDHHRYTAPRSPSLCLPHTVVHQPARSDGHAGRQQHHLLTAANAPGPSTGSAGLAPQQRLLLSPTHSTGGSSSPSPTGWHHQNAAALAAIAISHQQQLVHTMPAQPSRQQHVGRNQFGRNRLESLESDRGSSPSWSASTSSLRSSIGGGGGGNSIYSALAFQQHQQQRKRSSGSICSTASSSGVHSLASTTSGGAGCLACQQLASKCQTRNGHLAQKQPPATTTQLCSACAQHQQQQPQCGAQILRQLREEALEGAKLGPLATSLHPTSAATLRGLNSLGSSQQVGPNQRPLQVAVNQHQQQQQLAGQTQTLIQQQQQQEQAVYFFLCCCQRNGPKNDGDSAASPTASQADNEPENVNPRFAQAGASSQQQQQHNLRPQAQEPERRVSLVARPAIVGAPDCAASPASGSGPQQQQARRRSVAATAADLGPIREGSKSLTSRNDSASAEQQQQQQNQQQQDEHELAPQGMGTSSGPAPPSKHGAHEEQKESRQIPKNAVNNDDDENEDGNLRGQLSALLNQLDGYQRRGRQLGADERELLAALGQRVSSVICDTAQATETGRAAPAGPPLPSSADMAASTDRANMMRYSTPNLLLSSNFELLLRQQDRRKQEQSDQADQDLGPPEATEAWFLSRSPTSSGGQAAAGPGAAASRTQRGSRESIRLRALDAASGKVAPAAQLQQQQQGATSANQRSDTQSGLPADGHLGPEVRASLAATEAASSRGVLDQQSALASGGSCQSASDGICKEQTFDETLAGQRRSQPERDEAPPIHVERPRTTANNDDDEEHDANPIRRRQRDAEREQAPPGASATGHRKQRAAPGEQVACAADGRAPVASSPVAFIVHDKSMAQARYLYSTLTSNAGALLATGAGSGTASAQATSSSASQAKPATATATATANQQQAQNTQAAAATSAADKSSAASRVAVSPTRPTGPQRKQAQFVAQQRERQLRELAQQRQQQQQQQQQQHQSTLASAGEASKLIGPLAHESSASASARKTRTRQQGGNGDGGGSGSDSDNNDDDDDGRAQSASDDPREDKRAAGNDEQVGEPAPEIIESVCEQRRRSSQSSQVGLEQQHQQQQQQQQLQPMSMDPEMHALWAQGADLDTGNGNFIQATRRRRSVHAIHQVQLHQALQQQHQHQQQVVGCGGGVALKLGPAGQLAHERRSQQLSAADLPTGTGGRLTSGAAAVDSSRKLKDKLRKLRSSSSIEETQYRAAHRSSTARARFVSDPSTGGGGSASGQLSSEPRATSKLQMDEAQAIEFDDELEAATAAAEELNLEADILKPSLVEEEDEEEEEHQVELTKDEEAEAAETEQDEERRVCLSNGELEYDLDELESSDCMLANLFQWNYPIFDLAQQYGQSILSKLSYRIFYDSGFFESFKIPKRAFFNFFHALEEGYLDKPYHNRLHAADVLHAVYYLTSQPIGNFCQVPLDLIELYDNLLATTKPSSPRLARALELSRRTTTTTTTSSVSSVAESNGAEQQQQQQQQQAADDDHHLQMDGEFVSNLHNHIVAIVVAAAAAAADSELPFGIMGANLTALEVMALYTAAAMHDFQHPGRTNSFLVATNSPLALLYNDRSVLENHHSAAAWALFYSGPGYDWLCNLEKDEFKRFRFMIIELILATDLMRHYELVSAFNKKLHNVGRHNIDWFCESDRLLVMEIIIKLADVNGPMKGHHLHCQWTDRIAMEFYEQGDEERARNLPVSLYMDRSDPRLPELQKSFINHLVGPLSHSYAAAGFFPKSSEPEMLASAGAIARAAAMVSTTSGHDDKDDHREGEAISDDEQAQQNPQSESVYSQTKYWLIDNSREGRKKLNKQFLECVQTMNLRDNFLYWDAKSREKQQQMQQISRKLS